jgi:hypothetical protein
LALVRLQSFPSRNRLLHMLRKHKIQLLALGAFTLLPLLASAQSKAEYAYAEGASVSTASCSTQGGCTRRQMGMAAAASLLIITLATTAVEKLSL